MKRIIGFIVFLNMLFISCDEHTNNIDNYVVNKNILKINDLNINLDSSPEKINSIVKMSYETERMPGFLAYYFDNNVLMYYVNNYTGKLDSIQIQFFDEGFELENKVFLSVDDFEINADLKYKELLSILENLGINYKIDNREVTKIIRLDNHRIIAFIYFQNDLSRPFRVQFVK